MCLERKIRKRTTDWLIRQLKKERAEHERVSRWRVLTPRQGFNELDILQNFAAGLRTHEQELADFLIFRAGADDTTDAGGLWQVGQPIPRRSQATQYVKLEDEIVDISTDMRCPISYEALQDPVTAADGQTYSLRAITQWFNIRQSSPMTGLPLTSTDLRLNNARANEANAWIHAEDLLMPMGTIAGRTKRRRTNAAQTINVTFSGASATFVRTLPITLSMKDLYKVAFRGLRGRHTNFSLSHDGSQILPEADTTIEACGIPDNATVQMLVFAETQNDQAFADTCLVKVFSLSGDMLFGFWTPKVNAHTVRYLLVKYHRFLVQRHTPGTAESDDIWINMSRGGDAWVHGTPLALSTTLSDLFRKSHARGSLLAETLWTASPTYDNGQLVHKVVVAKSTKRDRKLSRLEVLKQMFEALVNRMLAYSYRAHLGLVTVSTEARETQALTHVIENFRSSVEGLEHKGETALWVYPTAKKRIICLSDGKDTNSARSASEVYAELRQHGIALDSICIGDELNDNLKTLSYFLGSYCFHPKNMEVALAICEMEPMLSLKERPDIKLVNTSGHTSQQQFLNASYRANYTSMGRDVYPARKQHDRINNSFIELTTTSARRSSSTTAMTRSNIRTSRLLSEMQSIAQDPNPQYDCYISKVDMSFWKVVMKGPSDTPYENGIFLLYLDMPENYPAFPPKGRFITNMLHPNVNRHGRICHSIFDRDWTSDTSLTSVLNTIYGLLFQADYSDPVHTTVTLGYHHDQVEFADEVREHVAKHASKSAAEWREELTREKLTGEDVDVEDEDEDPSDEDEDEDNEDADDDDEEDEDEEDLDDL